MEVGEGILIYKEEQYEKAQKHCYLPWCGGFKKGSVIATDN